MTLFSKTTHVWLLFRLQSRDVQLIYKLIINESIELFVWIISIFHVFIFTNVFLQLRQCFPKKTDVNKI